MYFSLLLQRFPSDIKLYGYADSISSPIRDISVQAYTSENRRIFDFDSPMIVLHTVSRNEEVT